MPLPKIGQISRLVADFRSPPKHGGSLVVEAGFPTSVIDLIVKNRDRLKKKKKKPSSKKKKEKEVFCEEREPISLPYILTPSSNLSSDSTKSSPSEIEIDNSKRPPPTGKEIQIPPLVVANEAEEDLESRGTFMVTVKVLFTLILAFATKKLAIGITISTFLLLLFKFLALRVFCFLKPCCDGRKRSFNSFVERVFSRKVLITTEKNVSSSLIEEIELVDIDFDSLGSERRWGICLTQDFRQEIQFPEPPGFDMIDRRWNSDTEMKLLERRWRSDTGFDLRTIGPSKIDQAQVVRGKEIQSLNPDSRLLTRERRWGTDLSKAPTLEVQLLEAGLHLSEEIQVVESDTVLISRGKRWGTGFVSEGGHQARTRGEIKRVEPHLGLLSREKRWGVSGASSSKRGKKNSEKDEKISDPRNQKTSSAKIKSKKLFTKLIPKKFSSSLKKADDDHKNQPGLISQVFVSLGEEDEEATMEEGQEQRVYKYEKGEAEDEEDKYDEVKGEAEDEPTEEKEEGEKEFNGFDDFLQIDTNVDLVEGNGRRRRRTEEDNYGYVIMILIVLAGLVQGRFMALVLTMVWCLLVKLLQTVQRILKKF